MGALYWAAALSFAGAARENSSRFGLLAGYTAGAIAVLLLVVTLVHLDKFDMDSLFGIFWLVAYIVAPPLALWAIADQRRRARAERPRASLPLPTALRVALAAESVVLIAFAALMLAYPEGAADIWPWQLTPLTSRAIGSLMGAVGLIGLLIVRDGDMTPVPVASVAYVALGALQLLAVALHSEDLGDDDLSTAVYVAAWAVVLLTGVYGAWCAARSSSRS
jgi:hypothetical protein